MRYKLTDFATRSKMTFFGSYGAAAAALRKLDKGWFVQGPTRAWFFEDVTKKEKENN